GYGISGQRLEVIAPAHRPIVKTPLPYPPPDPPRTTSPPPPHHPPERLGLRLHPPTERIRHPHIAPGLRTALQPLHTQVLNRIRALFRSEKTGSRSWVTAVMRYSLAASDTRPRRRRWDWEVACDTGLALLDGGFGYMLGGVGAGVKEGMAGLRCVARRGAGG